jgi:hypothetical protein
VAGTADGGFFFVCWVGLVGLASTLAIVLTVSPNTRALQGRICFELAGILALGGVVGGLVSGMYRP